MGLARTTLLNGAATGVRLASGLVLNKLLAVYVGPNGYGLVGHFQSLVAMVSALAGGALAAGVTKLGAEHGAAPERQQAVWRTAMGLGLAGALAAALLLLLVGPAIEAALGLAGPAPGVTRWLAASALLLAVNAVLLAALSGMKRVEAFVTANIVGSLAALALAGWLVTQHGLHGALVALPLGQALAGVVTALVFRHAWLARWRGLVGRIDPTLARALGGFVLMALTTATVVPLSQMLIREGIERVAGTAVMGLWQAMWKLSETHLLLLTTTLSLHFLPRFAEIRQGRELVREIRAGYRFVLPLVLATAGGAYLLREPLVRLLFSAEFVPLTDALGWQLVGDVLKIVSWVPAYTMISHARTRLYMASEIAFAVLLAAASIVGSHLAGLVGAAQAYALTFAVYGLFSHAQAQRLAARLDKVAGGPAR